MAFDIQTLVEASRCAECASPNQKQNVLLYLLNAILENGGSGGTVLHNFLSLTHPDTVPGPPLRGSLIVGNATPDWEALLIGAANRVLRSDGTDATWAQLALGTDVTGVLPIANGGTNSSAALNNNRIMVSSAGSIVESAALTNGQLLIGSTGAAPVAAGLTAGTNITIGVGAGSITVNAVMPGGFTGFDNPSAQVGLAAVNGVATTAMRSDAAPALSQAIAPTWTGTHIFSPVTANAIQINPFGVAAGNTSELRFLELAASGTNYAGFKAADTMAASEIYVLPNAAPSANRFLRAGAVAAGVSTLTWAQISLTADVTGILPVANGGTGTSTAFTLGSVIFAGAAGVFTEDNANFFWDNTNNRLGIGTAAPASTLHVFGPGSFQYGFAAGALLLGADLNATTVSVNSRKIGRVNMVSYDGGATNTFLFGGDLQSGTNDIFFGGVAAGSQYAATGLHFFTGATQTTTGGTERMSIIAGGNVGIRVTAPTAYLHIAAGTATAGTGPLKFTSGPVLTAPEIGVFGFDTDDVFFTITTGTARKRFLFADPVAGLTSGRVPFATTNGRLTDDSDMTFSGSTLTITNVVFVTAVSSGQAALAIGPFGAAAGNTGELRFLELAAGGVNYTGFKASDAMAASEIYVLPDAAPSANRFLQAAAVAGGVSALSWAQVSLTADVTGILPVANGGSGTSTAFTQGSVIFAGPSGVYAQDNANFFWDDTNNRLGLGTVSPNQQLELTGNLRIPATTSTVGIIFQGANRLIHTFGTQSLFVGVNAGNLTNTGNFNVGIGQEALNALTSGTANMAVGFRALKANTSGNSNLAIGQSALLVNTTGSDSIALGSSTLLANTTGTMNTALGTEALFANTTGDNNTGIGVSAGRENQTGSQNVCIGNYAGSGAVANSNTANTFVGNLSGNVITTGGSNCCFGYGTGSLLTTGSNNICIGVNAGNNLTTGAKNIVIGYNIDSPTATNNNTLNIGNLIFSENINQNAIALSDGGVGIGVITPLAKFHVTNSAAATVGCIIKAAAAQSANLTEWQDSSAVILSKVNSTGNVGVRMAATALTAYLHIAGGTTAASTAPIKLISGTSMTAAEAGAVEFTTDDLFFTITTGAARKRLLMADAVGGLTATRVPFATTNGRLTDDAGMTFGASLLTVPNITITAAGVLQLGNAAVVGEALVSTHTLTVKDSGGTTYRIMCLV